MRGEPFVDSIESLLPLGEFEPEDESEDSLAATTRVAFWACAAGGTY
jgi:hypothetical protein